MQCRVLQSVGSNPICRLKSNQIQSNQIKSIKSNPMSTCNLLPQIQSKTAQKTIWSQASGRKQLPPSMAHLSPNNNIPCQSPTANDSPPLTLPPPPPHPPTHHYHTHRRVVVCHRPASPPGVSQATFPAGNTLPPLLPPPLPLPHLQPLMGLMGARSTPIMRDDSGMFLAATCIQPPDSTTRHSTQRDAAGVSAASAATAWTTTMDFYVLDSVQQLKQNPSRQGVSTIHC